jgi:5-formyltetrahydrofolate cyclo-ligase
VSDPTSPPPPRSKRATRQTLRARRDALTAEDRAAASLAIARGVGALVDARLAGGHVLALYANKGTEVDTAAIADHARARGIAVVYPRVVADDRILAFHAAAEGELVIGAFRLREPRADAPAIELGDITAFVIPGLAFDVAGGRTGWGMGHYDATLARAPGALLRIGLAFECQLVDRVPRDPHDIAMTHVVTEAATYAVG